MRFIIPVAVILAAAYVFRLFGFGWKIYKPASASAGASGNATGFQRELDMIRGGQYLPYVALMADRVKESGGDLPAFERLRSEFSAVVGETGTAEASKREDIDRIIGQMVSMYVESTGDEGLSLYRGRG